MKTGRGHCPKCMMNNMQKMMFFKFKNKQIQKRNTSAFKIKFKGEKQQIDHSNAIQNIATNFTCYAKCIQCF